MFVPRTVPPWHVGVSIFPLVLFRNTAPVQKRKKNEILCNSKTDVYAGTVFQGAPVVSYVLQRASLVLIRCGLTQLCFTSVLQRDAVVGHA